MEKGLGKEEILKKHCPSMDDLFLDYSGRQFRERVFLAMEEYASQQTESKDKELSDFKALVKQMRDDQMRNPMFYHHSTEQVDKILGL